MLWTCCHLSLALSRSSITQHYFLPTNQAHPCARTDTTWMPSYSTNYYCFKKIFKYVKQRCEPSKRRPPLPSADRPLLRLRGRSLSVDADMQLMNMSIISTFHDVQGAWKYWKSAQNCTLLEVKGIIGASLSEPHLVDSTYVRHSVNALLFHFCKGVKIFCMHVVYIQSSKVLSTLYCRYGCTAKKRSKTEP